MSSYKQLIVWQKSFWLTLDVYKMTQSFPKEEQYILTSQMRRASVSIVSNIAEGASRKTTNEYRHFVSIAFSSAIEVETQLLLAKELNYIDEEQFEKINNLLTEVLKMLNKLQTTLKGKLDVAY